MKSLVFLALAACSIHTVAGRRLRVEDATVGAAHVVGFVEPSSPRQQDGESAEFAFALPGGDWLASIDAHLVRLSPDGRATRWAAPDIRIRGAVLSADGRRAIATAIEPPVTRERRSVMAIDLATGAIAWRAPVEPAGPIVRVAGGVVVSAARAEVAIADDGRVLWTAPDPALTYGSVLAATADGATVLVASTPDIASTDLGVVHHAELAVRALDAATGAVRGETHVAAAADFFQVGVSAMTPDGRFALAVADIHATATPGMAADGKPTTMTSQDATARVVVIDVHDPAHLAADAFALPAPRAIGSPPARLAAGEVAFVDHYAAAPHALGVVLVDLDHRTARRARVFQPRRVLGIDSFVQVTHIVSAADRVTFAGVFAGDLGAIHGRVERVDGCAAQGDIECSRGRGDITISPFAGFIGTIGFAR